jgi:hypothetical protein
MIKVDQNKAQERATKARITELKQLLADSDYKVLPDYDKTDDDIMIKRQAWRAEIRTLEAQLAV